MWNRLIVLAAILILASAPQAYAQRVELSGIFGFTVSDGVTGAPVLAADGNLYDTVDVKDSGSWGFGIGFNAGDNAEVGFLFGQQLSTFAVEGTAQKDVGDLTITSYHPYFAYNFGAADATARPYFLIGLGATNYGSVSYTRAGGQAGETESATQFSSTAGAA
jgi:hypothetical protein